jgi:hypothetical protein
MPNPWTGKGNPYTRAEVVDRLYATLRKREPIIAAGAGTGISAKFIEKGGADLVIVYNSGRFRMAGHGSTAGLMAYGDANEVAMEIGEYEVLPVVEEIPVICGVHATDPRRRMWHWLLKVKDMGFSGVNNFPTHCIVDGRFRQILEETGMSVRKEFEMVARARKMDLFTIVYVSQPREARAMAEAGADAVIAPGCLDMVNFGEPESVPARFAGRCFYRHNPQVTLMRTTRAECAELGRILAEKINAYRAPTTVLFPAKGLSAIGEPGQPFWDPGADAALLAALQHNFRGDVPLVVLDVPINDPSFAKACAEALLANIR